MTNTYLYTYEPTDGLRFSLLKTPAGIKIIDPCGTLLGDTFVNEMNALRVIDLRIRKFEAIYRKLMILSRRKKYNDQH